MAVIIAVGAVTATTGLVAFVKVSRRVIAAAAIEHFTD
jgi:hypothetical protein